MSERPRLLDLFCGAGGCSVGYTRAGFDVVGVDNRPMPNYPFADAWPECIDDSMRFRLLLAKSPHIALAAFLRGTAGVAVCRECKGTGKVKRLVTPYDSEVQDCPQCRGIGSTEAELREAYREVNESEEKALCHECAVVKRGLVYSSRWGGSIGDEPCMDCGKDRILGFYELTGGPPSADLLRVASDWMEEHGMQMECDVLRGMGEQ